MHMHILIIWFTGAASVSLPASTSDALHEYFLLNFKPPPPLWHPAAHHGCVSHHFLIIPPELTCGPFESNSGMKFSHCIEALLEWVLDGWFTSQQSSKLDNSHSHLGSKTITSTSPLLSDVEP